MRLYNDYKAQQQQEQLRQQYQLPQKVVVVEKSAVAQIWKTTWTVALQVLRIAAMVILAVLAVIGLATLVFPSLREPFFELADTTLQQIKNFLS